MGYSAENIGYMNIFDTYIYIYIYICTYRSNKGFYLPVNMSKVT
jgi:hypothetical protein